MTEKYHYFKLNSPLFLIAISMLLIMLSFGGTILGQSDISQSAKSGQKDDKDDQATSFSEMLVKQQIGRRKKEHEELLKRGEEVLKLSDELESSFESSESLSSQDIAKLQTLERLVSKIRKDLGGDDDESILKDGSSSENSARQNLNSAFRFLRESTKRFVDELKKTSRFSISAAAIQTSNIVIRFTRFLRLNK